MRLIDADAFDERVRAAGGMSEEELSEDFKDGVQTVLYMMSKQPTITAQPNKRTETRACDCISRKAAIDAYGDWYVEEGTEEGFIGTVKQLLEKLPSAQPDIKQAAKLLLDFIESCPGGDSYLITPNGEELRTDWGYATEGIQLILDWAERRIDEDN